MKSEFTLGIYNAGGILAISLAKHYSNIVLIVHLVTILLN